MCVKHVVQYEYMYNVNIITESVSNTFVDDNLDYEDYGLLRFYENSGLDIDWDVVVVYEKFSSGRKLRVKKGGLIFISGEPPLSREYAYGFLKQFDLQITSHKYSFLNNYINDQQSLDWWFAKSFKTKLHRYSREQLKNLAIPPKNKLISIISSSKSMMPGHNKRQYIISHLKEDFNDYIDFYGGEDGNVEFKCDAILPYKYCICIENSFIDDYWTEKYSDPLLGFSIPIYSGCKNITKYFDEKGFFVFEIGDYNSLKQIINSIIASPDIIYEEKKDAMIENRDLLFSKYHLFPHITELLNSLSLGDVTEVELKTADSFPSTHILMSIIRIKRLIFKLLYMLK